MSDEKPTNVSRREFARNLARFLVLGGLTHFSLANSGALMPPGTALKGDCPGGRAPEDSCLVVKGEFGPEDNDYCPGGGPAEDICRIDDGYSDYCPGEKEPEDECSASGLRSKSFGKNVRADDSCSTGLPENDKCDTKIVTSDQCLGQGPAWDECDPTQDKSFDVCYSGLDADDACNPDGGSFTDECPGGGVERDTCTTSGAGDECSPEKEQNPDSCKTSADGLLAHRDVCGTGPGEKFGWQADVCYLGVNDRNTNIGGGDLCKEQKAFGIFDVGDGGDTCLDGSKEQDFCGGDNADSGKEIDVCIPTAAGEKDDYCHPVARSPWGSALEESDDICYAGLPSSDECNPAVGDQDECPGGVSTADECSTGRPPDDECPGGASDVDVCLSGVSGSDECVSSLAGSDDPIDDCTALAAESAE